MSVSMEASIVPNLESFAAAICFWREDFSPLSTYCVRSHVPGYPHTQSSVFDTVHARFLAGKCSHTATSRLALLTLTQHRYLYLEREKLQGYMIYQSA
jgi:hypothetical protein